MSEEQMDTLAESLPPPDFEVDPLHPVNQPVTVGEEVWFVLQPRTNYAGQLEERRAIVVKVWSADGRGNGCCNLVVFVDGTNDVEGASSGTYWATSRAYSKEPVLNHWHR